jgi:hypothetical protein
VGLDYDGYPLSEDVKILRDWPFEHGYRGLMKLLQETWWAEDWGFRDKGWVTNRYGRRVRRFRLSTGGWSGNEETIDELSRNFIFWSQCWVETRRGGHYLIEVPKRFWKP